MESQFTKEKSPDSHDDHKSIKSTGSSYFEEMFERFGRIESASGFDILYSKPETTTGDTWDPVYDAPEKKSKEVPCEFCDSLLAEVNRFSVSDDEGGPKERKGTGFKEKRCTCQGYDELDNVVVDQSAECFSPNEAEPPTDTVAQFIPGDDCSIGKEILEPMPNNIPCVSGAEYLFFMNRHLETVSVSEDSDEDHSDSGLSPENSDEDSTETSDDD